MMAWLYVLGIIMHVPSIKAVPFINTGILRSFGRPFGSLDLLFHKLWQCCLNNWNNEDPLLLCPVCSLFRHGRFELHYSPQSSDLNRSHHLKIAALPIASIIPKKLQPFCCDPNLYRCNVQYLQMALSGSRGCTPLLCQQLPQCRSWSGPAPGSCLLVWIWSCHLRTAEVLKSEIVCGLWQCSYNRLSKQLDNF